MTHVNLGLLLDQFGIQSFDDFRQRDYRDKDAFLGHVTSACGYKAQEELNETLSGIEYEHGLKMCFQVRKDDIGNWHNIPNDTFARKLALFTTRTVITFPFHQISHSDNEDLRALLSLLCATRPFLKEGYITIVPADNHTPEMKRTLKKLRPANFRLDELEIQFEEREYKTLIPNVFLPRLVQVSPEEIISIRKEEEDKYRDLENRLERDLMKAVLDERQMLGELQLIDQTVRRLDSLASEIQDAVVKGSIWRLVALGMCIGAFLLGPAIPPAALALTGLNKLAESASLYALFESIREEWKKSQDVKTDDFYLFWKINHPGNIIAFREILEHYGAAIMDKLKGQR
jgi:hypothetical protein